MDKVKTEFLGMVAMFVMAVSLSGHLVAAAEVRNDRRNVARYVLICDGHFRQLYRYCKRYIKANRIRVVPFPSRRCCQAVEAVDLYCICREIPARLEQYVSMRKVSIVAGDCGHPIQSGTQCGRKSYSTFKPVWIHEHLIWYTFFDLTNGLWVRTVLSSKKFFIIIIFYLFYISTVTS